MGLRRPRARCSALTRGTDRAHVVRAVLEGVAHRGADLVEAAEADTGLRIAAVRVDGGMSANPTFVQALADATGRASRCRRSSRRRRRRRLPRRAGRRRVGRHRRRRSRVVTGPRRRAGRASRPRQLGIAVERAAGWIPELSALDV